MSRVEHDWFKPRAWSEDAVCKRCSTIRFEEEINLPSQGTHIRVWYSKDRKDYNRDPGCCERE